jgi:hypothetical protein
MKSKIVRLMGLILIGLFLSGCATSRLTQLNDVGPNEAIAVAKFQFIYNGKVVTKGCNVIFDPLPAFGPPKNQYILFDESGYVFMKLPAGVNSIRIVIHKSGLMQHHFQPEELTCQLRGDGVINYIGDVTFNWDGMGSGSAVGVTALTGVVGGSFLTGGKIAVTVESNKDAAQTAFRQKFPTAQNVTPSLLVVKPSK